MSRRRKRLFLISCVLYFVLFKYHFRNEAEELRLSGWFNPRKRPDVVTTTGWHAPVIWEGTFNRQVLEEFYGRQNLTIGLAVLATGRLADQYLEPFVRSASKHFMTGHRVVFYIMADAFYRLPRLELGPLQTLQVLDIRARGADNSDLVRMKNLAAHIVQHIRDEVDFLFSMMAERVFQNAFGVETLGTSVAQLHAWWYFKDTEDLPYERRPGSAACVALGQGDFYYDGTVLGGTPLEILNFIKGYLDGISRDKKNGLNSTYERHLNKYFVTHKPTKLLSPEYSWDAALWPPEQVWLVKAARRSPGPSDWPAPPAPGRPRRCRFPSTRAKRSWFPGCTRGGHPQEMFLLVAVNHPVRSMQDKE